jgi:hypothetical protein
VSATVKAGEPIQVGEGPWVAFKSDDPWAVFPVRSGELLRVVSVDPYAGDRARPAPVGFEGRVASRGVSPSGPWVAIESTTERWPRSGFPVCYLVSVACCARVIGGGR